ncbi:MAG: hypothetical protein MUE30_03805 [Spirosomaceae bacterium]|jgi:hypothetical protein|nr:hypothetical protein [Spirosomataceae bacterium]
MIIANPIYDVVFKLMMENEKVAKFFIGTLLDEVVEHLEVKPQEFTYTDELAGLAVFRLDFIAIVRNQAQEQKKVLIEIQKARNLIDLMRFRNYLAEQYKKEDKLNDVPTILPITTIYILGFKLPEITTPCFKVERNYRDLVENKIINTKSDFVEKLTHDSFVVQVDRITDRYQTKLDKLLSIFEQKNFIDDSKIVKRYDYQPDIEELKITTDILHFAGTDPAERKKIEVEQEAWRTVNAMFEEKEREFTKKLEEKDKKLEEKDKKLEAMENELRELKRRLGLQ